MFTKRWFIKTLSVGSFHFKYSKRKSDTPPPQEEFVHCLGPSSKTLEGMWKL
jgi:hypothetical protein